MNLRKSESFKLSLVNRLCMANLVVPYLIRLVTLLRREAGKVKAQLASPSYQTLLGSVYYNRNAGRKNCLNIARRRADRGLLILSWVFRRPYVQVPVTGAVAANAILGKMLQVRDGWQRYWGFSSTAIQGLRRFTHGLAITQNAFGKRLYRVSSPTISRTG